MRNIGERCGDGCEERSGASSCKGKTQKEKGERIHEFSRARFEMVTSMAMSWRHSSSSGADRECDNARESSSNSSQ
jgi:hypothetical protein